MVKKDCPHGKTFIIDDDGNEKCVICDDVGPVYMEDANTDEVDK